MKIAEVGERYGISLDTLRYYERIGLIPPVHRNEGGIRVIDRANMYHA
jgi:DNA-binding transcriptional MerR regulator